MIVDMDLLEAELRKRLMSGDYPPGERASMGVWQSYWRLRKWIENRECLFTPSSD